MIDADSIAWDYAHRSGLGTDRTLVRWLTDIAESVVEDREQGYEVECYDIADRLVPVYTNERLDLMAASNTLACMEPPVGGDNDSPAEAAAGVLYEVACEMASIADREYDDAERENGTVRVQ